MKLDKGTEGGLRKIVSGSFSKTTWTFRHTLVSVHWIREIMLNGDNERILVAAMYLHDIGYPKLNETKLDDRLSWKKRHMIIGAEKSRALLKPLGFKKKEIARISHLIKVHDALPKLKTHEELLVMTADTLAMIDYKRIKSSLYGEDLRRALDFIRDERIPRMKSRKGKCMAKKLLEKAVKEQSR